jgi:hypothetical protein
MFKRKREPESNLEVRVVRAIAELEDATGDAVTAMDLMNKMGPGLTTTLEYLTEAQLIERCTTKDGLPADRLTACGRAVVETGYFPPRQA